MSRFPCSSSPDPHLIWGVNNILRQSPSNFVLIDKKPVLIHNLFREPGCTLLHLSVDLGIPYHEFRKEKYENSSSPSIEAFSKSNRERMMASLSLIDPNKIYLTLGGNYQQQCIIVINWTMIRMLIIAYRAMLLTGNLYYLYLALQ
jgi:hypothetical protein